MIKALLLSSFMMVALALVPSFAETGEQVCQTMPSWQENQDCLARIQGHYVDQDAGSVCIRARYAPARVQCLGVSINKEYNIDEAQNCNQHFGDQERIDCMQRLGILIITDPRSRARFDQIGRMAQEGMRAVQAGDARAAYYWFQRIHASSNPQGK